MAALSTAHPEVSDQLTALCRPEGGPGTLLFAGPDGVGRKATAIWLGAYLNCEASGSRPCGRCDSCLAAAAGTHLDIREIAPAATTKSGRARQRGEITIDQLVRRSGGEEEPLADWLRSRPFRRVRLAIIDQAESMNQSAANAFLKMLEEPPRWALIVLIAPGPEALLPTVASRAATLRFAPLAVDPAPGFESHPAVRLGQPVALERALAAEAASLAARDAADGFLASLNGDLLAAVEGAETLTKAVAEAVAAGAQPGPLGWLSEPLRRLPPAAYAAAMDELRTCEEALAAYASAAVACLVLALRLRVLVGMPS